VKEAVANGEAEISKEATPKRVLAPPITPPLPAFTNAITDAIRQWEYRPLEINGVAEPVCQTVTVNIDVESVTANPGRK
jgi:hypothetical protein